MLTDLGVLKFCSFISKFFSSCFVVGIASPVAAIGVFVSAVELLVLMLTLLSPVSGEIDGFRSSLICVNYRGA